MASARCTTLLLLMVGIAAGINAYGSVHSVDVEGEKSCQRTQGTIVEYGPTCHQTSLHQYTQSNSLLCACDSNSSKPQVDAMFIVDPTDYGKPYFVWFNATFPDNTALHLIITVNGTNPIDVQTSGNFAYADSGESMPHNVSFVVNEAFVDPSTIAEVSAGFTRCVSQDIRMAVNNTRDASATNKVHLLVDMTPPYGTREGELIQRAMTTTVELVEIDEVRLLGTVPTAASFALDVPPVCGNVQIELTNGIDFWGGRPTMCTQSSPYTIFLAAPPMSIEHLNITDVDVSSVNVTWTAPYSGGCHITHYNLVITTDAGRIVAQTTPTITMDEVTLPNDLQFVPDAVYTLTITACNEVGCSQDSEFDFTYLRPGKRGSRAKRIGAIVGISLAGLLLLALAAYSIRRYRSRAAYTPITA